MIWNSFMNTTDYVKIDFGTLYPAMKGGKGLLL